MASLKLITLILAAVVVWVRTNRHSSSPVWLYCHHMRLVASNGEFSKVTDNEETETDYNPTSVLEDAVLGLLTCFARTGISILRLPALHHDYQGRVCVLNAIGGMVSFIGWMLRSVAIEPTTCNIVCGGEVGVGPIARLGGSMAVIDASCAVLMAFAEPPILDSLSTFDDVARLLTGVLIGLVTLPRCLFALACNALCYGAHQKKAIWTDEYAWLILIAGVLWIAQIIITAITVADLVVAPLAVSLTRTIPGDDAVIAIALFLTFVNVAIPSMLRTLSATKTSIVQETPPS